MKRLRIILASLAVILAISASFAFRDKVDPPCRYSQQYYKSGFNYFPTGQLGLHYTCIICPFACTYYLPDPVLQPDNYVPCQQGVYQPIYTQP